MNIIDVIHMQFELLLFVLKLYINLNLKTHISITKD